MKPLFLVASLILVGYILVPDHEHAAPEAHLTVEGDDCWTGELNPCDDHQKVSETMLKFFRIVPGYDAILEKVGKDFEQLEAEYGGVEHGLIALGCDDQAPGVFRAVLRPGDTERDFWCSIIVG